MTLDNEMENCYQKKNTFKIVINLVLNHFIKKILK